MGAADGGPRAGADAMEWGRAIPESACSKFSDSRILASAEKQEEVLATDRGGARRIKSKKGGGSEAGRVPLGERMGARGGGGGAIRGGRGKLW